MCTYETRTLILTQPFTHCILALTQPYTHYTFILKLSVDEKFSTKYSSTKCCVYNNLSTNNIFTDKSIRYLPSY